MIANGVFSCEEKGVQCNFLLLQGIVSKISAQSTSGLSVELLLRVIDIKYGFFSLLYFTIFSYPWCSARARSARGTPLLSTMLFSSIQEKLENPADC